MGLDDLTDNAEKDHKEDKLDEAIEEFGSISDDIKSLKNAQVSTDKKLRELETEIDNMSTIFEAMITEFNKVMDELGEDTETKEESEQDKGYKWK